MKKIGLLLLLLISSQSFAQIKFSIPAVNNLTSLKNCSENHLLILRTFRGQLDSEITRLATGIDYETSLNPQAFWLSRYHQLMARLLIKRIFVSQLESQLKAIDLDQFMKKPQPRKVFNTDNLSLNLEKELISHLEQATAKEFLPAYAIQDMKVNLVKSTASTLAVKTYQSVGSGLLTKIIAGGVSKGVLKSATLSMGSQIFASAGRASLLSLLTLPLQAYRKPPELVWTEILHKNPELILNPEWMKLAGSVDDPWWSHAYAILRRTSNMERAFKALVTREESEFLETVRVISRMREFKETSFPTEPNRNGIDNTYVKRPVLVEDPLPFWALKK